MDIYTYLQHILYIASPFETKKCGMGWGSGFCLAPDTHEGKREIAAFLLRVYCCGVRSTTCFAKWSNVLIVACLVGTFVGFELSVDV